MGGMLLSQVGRQRDPPFPFPPITKPSFLSISASQRGVLLLCDFHRCRGASLTSLWPADKSCDLPVLPELLRPKPVCLLHR